MAEKPEAEDDGVLGEIVRAQVGQSTVVVPP